MKSSCPYCNLVIMVNKPDDAFEESRMLIQLEIQHMEDYHSEIIADRLRRLDSNDPKPCV